MDKKSININGYSHIAYEHQTISEKEMIQKSNEYLNWLNERRSVREFSSKPIPKEIIENLILSASTAPSGAHKQPWTFCAISNREIKSKIREAAEVEEKLGYVVRMSERWKKDLAPLGTVTCTSLLLKKRLGLLSPLKKFMSLMKMVISTTTTM